MAKISARNSLSAISPIRVMSDEKRVHDTARSALRFQVICLPIMVISGLVVMRAASPGNMKQRIPKNRYCGERRHDIASISRPRRTRINIDFGHPGAVKMYRDIDSILTELSVLPCCIRSPFRRVVVLQVLTEDQTDFYISFPSVPDLQVPSDILHAPRQMKL